MLIVFFLISLAIFYSTIGYGIIFYKVIGFKKIDNNFAILGFFGLYFLTLIASYSHLVTPHNYLFNTSLLLIGITFLIIYYFKNKILVQYIKYCSYIFFLLFIAFILSKTNEDYSYYHLPNSIQFAQQKLQFGLGNLNHGFKHISSLFMLMSTHYIPILGHYLFNIANYLFYVFLLFFSIFEITKNKNINLNFSKLYLSSLVILFLVKFSRLSEFGSDISGQILVAIYFFYLIELIFNKKLNFSDREKYTKILLILLVFACTIKFILVIYSLPFIYFLFIEKNRTKLLKNIFFSRYLFFILLPIFFFLIFNFASTGCIIYPVVKTCFSKIYWALPSETVNYLNLHYETWAKGGKGPNFEINDPTNYVNSLSWVKHWISVYFFNKFLDYLVVIFSILLFIGIIFKDEVLNKKILNIDLNKTHFITYILLIIIFLIWFFNFPTLRYAGYLIVFLTVSLPIVYIFSKKINLENKVALNKIFALFFLSYSIFMFKNLNRLEIEFSKTINEHHNFINFPFYWVENVDFSEINIDGTNVYYVKQKCWDVPSPCVRNIKGLRINNKFGYKYFYYEK